MAWEWVAPVATATTAIIVGWAGIRYTWLTGKQSRDAARADAVEAREQQRLENTYVDLLDMAERAGQWAQMVCPIVDTHQEVPPLPSLVEQARTEALVRAFGSAEVRERTETWRAVVIEMARTVAQIEWEEVDPATRQRAGEPIARLTLGKALRPQEREARAALGNQVAVELRYRTDAKPE